MDAEKSLRWGITGWNKSTPLLSKSFLVPGIKIEFQIQEIGQRIYVINYYGPYEDRKDISVDFFLIGIY